MPLQFTLTYFGSTIPAFLFGIVIHELGHLVCGLLTGYRFVSFRILFWVWLKENGRIRFRFSKEALALGQCLLRPPGDPEGFRYVFYNLGGGLFNAVTAAACIVLCVFFYGKKSEALDGVLLMACVANVVLALQNLLPLSSKIPNDGRNIREAKRSKDAAYSLWLMLHVHAELSDGTRLRDMPESLFALPAGADCVNYLVANTAMLGAERLLDAGLPDESAAALESLPLERLQRYYRVSGWMDLLYYYAALRRDEAKACGFYNKAEIQKMLTASRQPPHMRIHAACLHFLERKPEEAQKRLEQAKKACESYPNAGIAMMEQDRIAELEERMKAVGV